MAVLQGVRHIELKSLENLHIVLVNPTHAGNVGGAARAMKNMCLSSLRLVSPPALGDVAQARASGAEDILHAAGTFSSMEAALADCRLVVGTSGRARKIAWPQLTPDEAADRLVQESKSGPVALVFGRERMGLTNEELDRCHFLVTIPSNPAYPSLNLACAVQVLAYEIMLASGRGAASGVVEGQGAVEAQPKAIQEEVQRFYEHLEAVLLETEFLDPANPRKLMRRLIRLFNRAELDQNEVNILRGILTAVQRNRRLDNT